jgi:hypothetical protein
MSLGASLFQERKRAEAPVQQVLYLSTTESKQWPEPLLYLRGRQGSMAVEVGRECLSIINPMSNNCN